MAPVFDLKAELDRYSRRSPRDAEIARLFLEFLQSAPDHLMRENLAGHITGSAFVVDEEGEETLLVHHRKLRLWVQPGGHADGNPDIRAVAEQELTEETGLTRYRCDSQSIFDLDRHVIPARGDIPEHFHYDVRFLFMAERRQKLVISDESIDLRWFGLKDIVEGDLARQGIHTDSSVRRMVRKFMTSAPGGRLR